MNERENFLRAIEFRYPEWIPCSVSFLPRPWIVYGTALEEIVLAHPRLFPNYEKGSGPRAQAGNAYKEGAYWTDAWGCVWKNIHEGMEGQVIEHPLADWSALAGYQPPDPLLGRDWDAAARRVEEARRQGKLVGGDGERLFDRMYFLRGWQDLMIDIATEPPELFRLIEMLEEYEMVLTQKWLALGVDIMSYHTDFATQRGLMISPAKFRKLLKPMFTHLFQTCRKAGVHVHLSSDGRTVDIVDDLLDCGVSSHDPQLGANTLEGIVQAYRGKLCARVDLDRQSFPFLTPQQMKEQVKQVVDRLALPEGGLMVNGEISSEQIPLENVEALCEAMELYCLP